MRKAVDLIVEPAKPIPIEQAEAREKLWTPEKEQERGRRADLDTGLVAHG